MATAKSKKKAQAKEQAKESSVALPFTASKAQWALRAMMDLGENRMGVVMSARVRRIIAALKEYVVPLEERTQEAFDRHSGGAGSIPRDTEAHAAFLRELEEYGSEEFELEIRPLALTDLSDELKISPRSLDALIEVGIITE